MVRSISELVLFRSDDDKDFYLNLFNKYQKMYMYKIYAYCIMSSHAHFIISSNGGDISIIMHKVNQCYAQHYNEKYQRYGHVFQDRFKSIPIDNDRYLLTLSAYIHNNPSDISGYEKHVENYRYSSLAEYIGRDCKSFIKLDSGFILKHFHDDPETAGKMYLKFVYSRKNLEVDKKIEDDTCKVGEDNKKESYELNDKSGSCINKDKYSPLEIISFVANEMGLKSEHISVKYNHVCAELRAICSYMMSCLCNMKQRQICSFVGNISCAEVSNLCSKGCRLLHNEKKYEKLVTKFLNRDGS